MIDNEWWQKLDPQWKQAFGEVFFHHKNDPLPSELESLFQTPVLRLAGPAAPYPNMSFELTDLSAIKSLVNLEIFICTNHQISEIQPLSNLSLLKSLFLLNNKINSLSGIENLFGLEQLYLQFNLIESMVALKSLTRLKELYIHDNKITSLDGITEEHEEYLEKFYCLPNAGIRQKEVIRLEREIGIICRKI